MTIEVEKKITITPLQYQMGRAYFMDFEFMVTKDTLIPRPETEILVEKTLELARQRIKKSGDGYCVHILDVGTGCGNIAISLTKYLEQSKITALDISRDALNVARQNAVNMAVEDRIIFISGDMLNPFKKQAMFDIIASNPPYVSEKDMETLPDEVKSEPRIALYGGGDGLDYYRILSKNAALLLKKEGFIVVEIGYDQSELVKKMFIKCGFSDINVYKDFNGIDRVVMAARGR